MQMGWAAVQVAHMALLPCISLNRKNKDKMCRIRTGFTFIAQLMALGLSFFIFWAIPDKLLQYRVLAYSVQFVGIVFTVIFLYYCREVPLSKNIDNYFNDMKTQLISNKKIKGNTSDSDDTDQKEKIVNRLSSSFSPSFDDKIVSPYSKSVCQTHEKPAESNKYINSSGQSSNLLSKEGESAKDNSIDADLCEERKPSEPILISDYQPPVEREINWRYWMGKLDFYIYLLVYMFVRLSINMTSTVIPFYMDLVLGYSPQEEGDGTRVEISIALIISTCGSVFNSLFLQKFVEDRLSKKNARLGVMIFAFLFVSAGCIPIFFISKDVNYVFFIASFFFGTGFSLGLSSASYLLNDVVGSKGSKAAFVYGAYSFSDKLSSGIVLALFLPLAKENYDVLKWTMPIFPPATIIFALIIVYLYGRANKDEPEEEEESDDIMNATNIIESSKFTFIAAK